MYLGPLGPVPAHVLGVVQVERLLARDIFDQEETWIAEGGNLTFSEWRARLETHRLPPRPPPPPAPPQMRKIAV